MPEKEFIIKFLQELDEKNIKFKQHFFIRSVERPISELLILDLIKRIEKLIFVEEQVARKKKERKFKLTYKLSNKYYLILIITISGKDLYIITAWNTNRKWQKTIQR